LIFRAPPASNPARFCLCAAGLQPGAVLLVRRRPPTRRGGLRPLCDDFAWAPIGLAAARQTWQRLTVNVSLKTHAYSRALAVALAASMAACDFVAPPVVTATETPEPPSSCEDALAYTPDEGAVQWSAVSGSAITVSGDVILAPALAKFENFRPSGLRFLGRHEVGPLASAFMNGRCAAIFSLVVDPIPEGESGPLCANGRAAFLAARVDEEGERLSLTIYSDTADPQRGGEPCRALDFVRSV
jgi:hypothetical protein